MRVERVLSVEIETSSGGRRVKVCPWWKIEREMNRTGKKGIAPTQVTRRRSEVNGAFPPGSTLRTTTRFRTREIAWEAKLKRASVVAGLL